MKIGIKGLVKNYFSINLQHYYAFFIDSIYSLIIGGILEALFIFSLDTIAHDLVTIILNYQATSVGSVLTYFFYISSNAAIQEIFFNTTLGKRIFGLVVVGDDYQKPTKRQIIIRNLVYPLDTFLLIGSFPLIKGKGKTLGGYISKTKLVSRKYLKELEERNIYGF